MEVSEVRVRIVQDVNDRLKAVCTVTLDDEFVVRDVKVVEGTHGLFVAMPSRKLSVPCPQCRTQNHLRARYCNECGQKLPALRIPADGNGREKAHRDIAHPITSSFRQTIQQRVLDAYHTERERSDTGDVLEEGDSEVGEYDSLIADLRGGERKEPGADARSGPARAGGAPGSGRPHRGRRRRERRHREDREPQPASTAAGKDADTTVTTSPLEPSETGPADARERERPQAKEDRESEDSFAAGLSEVSVRQPPRREEAAPPAPRTEPRPPAERGTDRAENPPHAGDACDDDDESFAAGIL